MQELMNSSTIERLEDKVLELAGYSDQMSDMEIVRLISQVVCIEAREHFLSMNERCELNRRLIHSLRGLDVLENLLEDDAITEIMVNGAHNVFFEKGGKIQRWDKGFVSEEKLYSVIQQIVSRVNRTVNESSPIVDARLPDGSRVHVVLPPIALNGAILTIRRFGKKPITMAGLVENGSISEDAADELKHLVESGYNIFISGGTDSGKTTFLNALSEFIPADERIITIEDSAELSITNIDNLVRLEARNANLEGDLEISIRDLIRAALRMRPDRIIVGEVRGGESLDMLQAMNTGHDGSLSTGHANSPEDMIRRLEVMVAMSSFDIPVSAVRAQIVSALDIMVHLERFRDGSRKVVSIVEVDEYEETADKVRLRSLFEFETSEKSEGRLVRKNSLLHTEKLIRNGYL